MEADIFISVCSYDQSAESSTSELSELCLITVSSLFKTTSLVLLHLLRRQLHSRPPWTCWIELFSLVIAAPYEVGCGIYIQDWSWAVFNYAMDCWHIPRIDLIPAVLDNFEADFKDVHCCYTRTDCLAELPAMGYYHVHFLLYGTNHTVAWTFPVASLQLDSMKIKGQIVLEFGHKDTYCVVPVLRYRGI